MQEFLFTIAPGIRRAYAAIIHNNKILFLEQLDNYRIIPQFVVPELKELDFTEGIKHIVNREERLN